MLYLVTLVGLRASVRLLLENLGVGKITEAFSILLGILSPRPI